LDLLSSNSSAARFLEEPFELDNNVNIIIYNYIPIVGFFNSFPESKSCNLINKRTKPQVNFYNKH